jgi:site-specific DNA-methyltransferase (adenine-specific)
VKPYYQDKWVKIYHGDCREILPQLDVKVDLVLTDPPYGITDAEWDKVPSREIFSEIFRISERQIIFGGHFFNLPTRDGWIIWNKMPFLKTGNQAELIWTSFLKKNQIVDFRYAGNVIGNTNKPDYRIKRVDFTSQKPIAFIEYLIKTFTVEGDLILDPFLGSGTTVIACKKLNHCAIGIEIREECCEIAAKRCSQEVMELKI